MLAPLIGITMKAAKSLSIVARTLLMVMTTTVLTMTIFEL